MQIKQQTDSLELFFLHPMRTCIYANAGTLFCIEDALSLTLTKEQ